MNIQRKYESPDTPTGKSPEPGRAGKEVVPWVMLLRSHICLLLQELPGTPIYRYHAVGKSPDFTTWQKWTGSAFGITTKVPKAALKYTKGETKKHESDNGSGTRLFREFCGTCGGGILEYGENAGDNTYVTYGSFENPEGLPPRGEFFCKYRESWMPEIPGSSPIIICDCWHPPPTSSPSKTTV
ncbi:DUF636 domain-containing protein [Ephemerocybe angulata]|uniref:DUF636 domain-containing protein n=1 Tax=Ephemerocybe angulata TaxID=980116 RepID=A0A8H6ICI1_9AGAR|nr:DUF636 domain-containing protein [Tulosesus angulatus]